MTNSGFILEKISSISRLIGVHNNLRKRGKNKFFAATAIEREKHFKINIQ